MKLFFREEGSCGIPFRISVGACRPDMESRSLLLSSLLRPLAPDLSFAPSAARIVYEPAGRPVLGIPSEECPFVSFSHAGAQTWAALSLDGPVGIDVACSSEFHPPYPIERVFSPLEWKEAAMVCGSPEDAAPLLWTLKEAAVKALGRGFRDLGPLDVQNRALCRSRGIVRCKIRAGRELSGLALRQESNLWIGIAWLTKEIGL